MRISAPLRRMLESMGDEVSQDLLTSENTEHGDYLGMRSGWLTYLPKAKLDVDRPYASRNRVRGKPARVARKFTANEHSDVAYENFHNLLESKAFSEKRIKILKGEDIIRAYNEFYDTRRQSARMRSCMVGMPRSQYSLYVENPHMVRLLTLWDRFKGEDVIIARALIWRTPIGIYVDRIYGSDTATTFMKNYIDRKGWMSYNGYVGGRRNGYEVVRLDCDITEYYDPHRRAMHRQMPYLDTFYPRHDLSNNRYYLEGELRT